MLILYDISSPLEPPRSFAPNPSKSRLALNFKRAPFTTRWVDILDIADTRKALNCPPVRKLDDGSDFFTLPMLADDSGKMSVLGDSFDIAAHLEEAFPDSGGRLFPPQCAGLGYESPHKDTPLLVPLTSARDSKHRAFAHFNVHVDATFTAYVGLVAEHMPLNPGSAEGVRAMFARRAHVASWDDLRVRGEAREQLLAGFKEALTSLAQLLALHDSGPFLDGSAACYADLIIGGWLNFLAQCMPEPEWSDFTTWHDGVFGRLHDALQQYLD